MGSLATSGLQRRIEHDLGHATKHRHRTALRYFRAPFATSEILAGPDRTSTYGLMRGASRCLNRSDLPREAQGARDRNVETADRRMRPRHCCPGKSQNQSICRAPRRAKTAPDVEPATCEIVPACRAESLLADAGQSRLLH